MKSLTLRDRGRLFDMLNYCITNQEGDTYSIWDGSTLLAWSLVHENKIALYTRKTHRRKGLATALYYRAKKDHPTLEDYRGESNIPEFFNALN